MSRTLDRRTFLGLVALTAGGAVAFSTAGCGVTQLVGAGQPGARLRSTIPIPEPFQLPLPVPAILAPVRRDATTDYYAITQKVGSAEIIPGLRTPMWTYGGTFPGPTIVSRSSRRVVIDHINTLPVPVAVHLHGGHTPHDSDGYPADLILPRGNSPDRHSHMPGTPEMGQTGMAGMGQMPSAATVGHRRYTYPLDQRAATLWYHDHRHGFTGPAVWNGLAGFHLIRDDEEVALPLPRGDRDVPLLITDRSFAADGTMPYPSADPTGQHPGVTEPYMDGVLGDVILVNGAPSPVAAVRRLRYRYRLLNASNARNYQLRLDPPPPGGSGFVQIGSDGGLLDRPRTHDVLAIAPAERFDIVIDFARYPAGTRVKVLNDLGTGSTAAVMAFDVDPTTNTPRDDTTIPATLSVIEPHDPAQAEITRTFLFQNHGNAGWTINGQTYDPTRPLATPRLGRLERWRFITDLHHPIHLHLEHFQVLSRNDSEPGPYDHGWKDTIDLNPAEAAEILIRFTDYPGRFVFHCHNLEHEDMAMMADFITT
jgi:FtsP/CotA-like multicopper oxidase with cupredoxin domain